MNRFYNKIDIYYIKIMNINTIPKNYTPKDIEKWYKFWVDNNYFTSSIDTT